MAGTPDFQNGNNEPDYKDDSTPASSKVNRFSLVTPKSNEKANKNSARTPKGRRHSRQDSHEGENPQKEKARRKSALNKIMAEKG